MTPAQQKKFIKQLNDSGPSGWYTLDEVEQELREFHEQQAREKVLNREKKEKIKKPS